MAKFQIIKSYPKQKNDFESFPTFVVKILKGELYIGNEFSVYETRHEIVYKILKVEKNETGTILHVNKPISWEDEFKGIKIDTNDKKVAWDQRFKHLNQKTE